MDFPQEQIAELKGLAPEVGSCEEGGTTFFLIRPLVLPDGCTPAAVDALLCPSTRDGYNSRLYFSERIVSKAPLNWNGNIRIAERNWFAFSWRTPAGLRLAQMVAEHIRAFRQ
jgi:hypothetical protein